MYSCSKSFGELKNAMTIQFRGSEGQIKFLIEKKGEEYWNWRSGLGLNIASA